VLREIYIEVVEHGNCVMYLLFEKIRWKNFLGTGNAWTEVELNRAASTLIVGLNGSGKSTLLDAVMFVLFGDPFRDTNKPLLINSINRKDCVVEVEFSLGPTKYKIVRGMKPTIFEIWEDGKLKDQEGKMVFDQNWLEEHVLKMTPKSCRQIIVIGSASFTPFMKLKAAERREIIENLLDIQIFSVMNGVLKERLSENKTTIRDTRDSS
jgi:DNA repair exonuclease SbcCD ATPase subunit